MIAMQPVACKFDRVIELLTSSKDERRACGVKELVDMCGDEKLPPAITPHATALLAKEPLLFEGGVIERLVDGDVLSRAGVLAVHLGNPGDVTKSYIDGLDDCFSVRALVDCVAEYKASTQGGIAASRARERKFFGRLFSMLEAGSAVFDELDTRVLCVRVVAFVKAGGVGVGWGLIQRLWEKHPDVVSKVLRTRDDSGESIFEFLSPAVVVDEGESMQESEIGNSMNDALVDETLPDGFADMSMGVRYDDGAALAAENDGPWLPPSGGSTPIRGGGEYVSVDMLDPRLMGVDAFLETPKPVRALYEALEALDDKAGGVTEKCMALAELILAVLEEGEIEREEFGKTIAETLGAISCGDCASDEMLARMIFISRNTVTNLTDQGFWFEWFEETVRVILSFLSRVEAVWVYVRVMVVEQGNTGELPDYP